MSKSSKLSTAIKAYNVSECVRDFDGNINQDWCITEDLNYWAGLEVVTVDGLEKILDFRHNFSDSHKSVHGCRPRWNTDHYTLSDWETTFENLAKDNEILMKEEAEREAIELQSFKDAVKKVQQSGARDFMTAIRWMMQAEGIDTKFRQDVERFFWDKDILYTGYVKTLINRICPIKR